MIKLWHSSLMYRTRLYDMRLSGVFKKYGNKILGVNFETAEPQEVEYRLNELIDKYNDIRKPTMEDICRFHLEFEKIHPFEYGNGRIGRFIYLKQILENKFAFKYMNGESAMEYKKALGSCSENNVKPLVDYIEPKRFYS